MSFGGDEPVCANQRGIGMYHPFHEWISDSFVDAMNVLYKERKEENKSENTPPKGLGC